MDMWKMTIFRKKRPGFALVFTVLIALAMIIPVMILASNAISRRKAVSGESVSDRILSIADAAIDKTLNKINTFNFTFTTPPYSGSDANEKAEDYLIGYYISQINGGVPNPSDPTGSLAIIKKNVSTFLYNFSNQHYYVVWDSTNNKVAAVSAIGPDGDIKTEKIKDLNTGNIYDNIMSIPNGSNYKTNNLWVEIDVRADYVPDQWVVTDTAYLLSKPNIKRTIQAVAERGQVVVNSSDVADGNWYIKKTEKVYFSDFSGLYHQDVYFGKYEITRGAIRSDGDVYMGGWARDKVYAGGTVYDEAVDGYYGNHDGRFGPHKRRLWWAKNNGYAVDGYPQADWPNGDAALFGSESWRDPGSDDGLQDKADKDAGYYVDGNATIVFNPNGTVTITPEGEDSYTVPMPPNGAIFVDGDATVSGTVKGRCSVGASDDIYIGGNIRYSTPPRTNKKTTIPPDYAPDALGLIAHNDILIPRSTFNAHHHLRVDAAMLAVNGSFGVADDVPWHYTDGSGEYEAWWNGCQAVWSTDNAPAIFDSWGRTKGYDIQHTNYDWNLYNFGSPPFYPVTDSRTETKYIPVTKPEELYNYLHSLPISQLQSTSLDPDYPYKYTYNGVTYYYDGTDSGTVTTATMSEEKKKGLYRISWKEQIANPVKPEP